MDALFLQYLSFLRLLGWTPPRPSLYPETNQSLIPIYLKTNRERKIDLLFLFSNNINSLQLLVLWHDSCLYCKGDDEIY